LARVIRAKTDPREPVAFLPADAALNFLLDRPNPTPFASALQASSRPLREEWVAAMERTRPRYVVVGLRRWLIDGIPVEVALPEVSAYVRSHYRVDAELPGFTVLIRRDGS
jgi:hypothetical protein